MLDHQVSILSLMWFQECHNRHYHQDIHHLQTMKAISHFQHHLVKYNGVIDRQLDVGKFAKVEIIDAMICCVGALSRLNFDMSELYRKATNETKKSKPYVTFPDLYQIHSVLRWGEMAFVLQNISKLVEGWDHVEALPYREGLTKNFSEAFMIYYGLYLDSGEKGFVDAYVDRLTKIKEKNMFHEDYLKDQLPRGALKPLKFKEEVV